MKVLISAIACHPNLGSEAKVGWDAARAISLLPDIKQCHVMTHVAGKEAITRAQAEGEAEGVLFHFFGAPYRYHPNRLFARLQSWLTYRDWQFKALERARSLHQQYGFSLAHHVTYASWRVPSRLWRLPIPFVFGPIGGGGTMPPAFRAMLGRSSRNFEYMRDATTALAAQSRHLKICCQHSAAVLAADSATAQFLIKHGAGSVRQLCQVFFSQSEASRLKTVRLTRPPETLGLRIFAGGNLEGRKGTQLSLRALAVLKHKGIPFSYTYGGWGPDLEAMNHLAHQLGIAQQVFFHRGYAGTEYLHKLHTSDVYLLPSIRETAGITMMEAMLAGCYPIVLAGTGAGDIVERSGGTAIHAKTPDEAVDHIAERLEWCYRQPGEMQQHAEAAGENVLTLYSEKAYQSAISEIYAGATANHARRLRRF